MTPECCQGPPLFCGHILNNGTVPVGRTPAVRWLEAPPPHPTQATRSQLLTALEHLVRGTARRFLATRTDGARSRCAVPDRKVTADDGNPESRCRESAPR